MYNNITWRFKKKQKNMLTFKMVFVILDEQLEKKKCQI